jgi:oligopeptide/dipeptide ABC transporter ATP-binding protein
VSLLVVQNLEVVYRLRNGALKAVDNVSFTVGKGEYFGIVGESGSGKTTLARAILRLLPKNGEITNGQIILNGKDITRWSDRELRAVRWHEMSFIPQSAMNALDPVARIGDQILESIQAHEPVSKAEGYRRAGELFQLVGLDPKRLRDYPHQFSGGMRQRVLIAMSLSLNPDLIIADEPTTALDVIVKDQILDRIDRIQKQYQKSLVLVTHDISVVAENCDKTIVMYGGKIVEYAATKALLLRPYHPYTLGLKNAFPRLRGPMQELISIPGSPPDLINPPSGCRFHTRCPFAQQQCIDQEPAMLEVEPGHYSACHFPQLAPEFRERAADGQLWKQASVTKERVVQSRIAAQ